MAALKEIGLVLQDIGEYVSDPTKVDRLARAVTHLQELTGQPTQRRAIEAFLAWLWNEGYQIVRWDNGTPTFPTREHLLERYARGERAS